MIQDNPYMYSDQNKISDCTIVLCSLTCLHLQLENTNSKVWCVTWDLPGNPNSYDTLISPFELLLQYMRSYLRPTYGFLLHLLVFIILPGDEMDNLQEIFVFIWQHQKRNQAKHPYRMKLDKLTMFQPKKGYPKLRGRASDIAGLAHCMFDLWSHYMDQGDQHQSAPPTHSSIFEIEFGAQRHFGNILAYLWPHSTSRTTIHQSIPRRAFNGPAPQATQWTLWGNWCDFF